MKTGINKYGTLPHGTKVPGFLLDLAKKSLRVYPVPGIEAFLAWGFNPYTRQLKITESPRHANVLLIGFPISKNLKKAAAVIFAQMPRPRMLVFVGNQEGQPLPEPDLSIEWDKINSLSSLLKNTKLINGDFEAFEPAFLQEALTDENENSHDHDHHHHEEHKDDQEHDGSEKEEENEDESDENNEDSEDHEDHGGGGMDFMSMVAMTKGKPKSKDGLIMDRNETYFGPFHSGLPDGLCVKMTLDGDTVIQAEVDQNLSNTPDLENFPKDPLELPSYMANAFPREPETLRKLTTLALTASSEEKETEQPSMVLENERLLNHLLWLRTLLQACGDTGLVYLVTQSIQDFHGNNLSEAKIKKLTKKISSRWYLKNRLLKLAIIPKNLLHHISGPIARAAEAQQNNAWGHLQIRLTELTQNFQKIEKSQGDNYEPLPGLNPDKRIEDQISSATVETANGKMSLQVEIQAGNVKNISLSSTSRALAALVSTITKDLELSDAIVCIASLGISTFVNKKLRR
ncbi:hypothetical protein SAMN05444483_10172 [Salegentibacter echinorum]|uniref:Uncharacterized protein n=1 Tax=Salegentibacter echinorum TaxID=1073325 RepID=A0A1M5BK49_SALEC|nr:hypothetical protein [Salegentibacter echinorum]SHF42931.1 hypothetical protein SAMN05444483_10172 [Salegentibacter echinorum]